jgi:multidrug efflux system membrane fusion protein
LKDVIVVPDAAVQRGPNGLFAYVVTPASKAELRDIKVGQIEGGLALVEKGLSPGERIIVSGTYRVQPGGAVQVLDDQEQGTAVKPTAQKVD